MSMSNKENSTLAFISHSPDTYPSQDPKVDEMQVARRKRRRTSPRELTVLEAEFRKCSKPCKQDREEIAVRVGMTEKAVQIWFQNKRQSSRKQKARPLTPSTPMHPQSIFDETPTPCRRSLSTVERPPMPVFRTPQSPPGKRLRLTMSEDGKAQVEMRSPLHALNQNISPLQQNSATASRMFSLPVTQRELQTRENECVSNLLFLRSGKW